MKKTCLPILGIFFILQCSAQGKLPVVNIKVISTDTSPVVEIVNSDNITFDKLAYRDGANLLFRVSGERSNAINIKNTDASRAKQKIVYELGATEKSVTKVNGE